MRNMKNGKFNMFASTKSRLVSISEHLTKVIA